MTPRRGATNEVTPSSRSTWISPPRRRQTSRDRARGRTPCSIGSTRLVVHRRARRPSRTRSSGHAGTGVGHDDLDRARVLPDAQPRPTASSPCRRGAASSALSTRLPSTVATSAESSGSSRSSDVSSADPQLDPALGGQRDLGHEQRRDGGVVHGVLTVRSSCARRSLSGVDVAHHLVVLPELDQAADRVQLVGELVGLRAQQLGRAAGTTPISLLEVGQLGAVAQRGDRAERRSPLDHPHAVHDQHPAAPDDHLVAGGVTWSSAAPDGRGPGARRPGPRAAGPRCAGRRSTCRRRARAGRAAGGRRR